MTKCLYIVPDVSVLSFLLQVMATRRSPQTKSPTSPADFSRDSPQSRSKSRGRSTERTRRRGASDSEEPKRPGAGDSEEKKAKRRASSSDSEEKKVKESKRRGASDSKENKAKESKRRASSDSEEKKVKAPRRRDGTDREEKVKAPRRRVESENEAEPRKERRVEEPQRRGASEPKRRGASEEKPKKSEVKERGRGQSVASSTRSRSSLALYSHQCKHCGTWCCGEFGLQQHRESSKKCLQYVFYGKGYSWSDAGVRAAKQWRKNQAKYSHQEEVKPGTSWVLKENQSRSKAREFDKKRNSEPSGYKAKEQERSRLEKTQQEKAKVVEKPKSADKQAAKVADDESSEYEYFTEEDSDSSLEVKPASSASAAPKASAPKASAASVPKASGPVAPPAVSSPSTGPVAPPAASSPSGGNRDFLAIADFYQSQANFLRSVGRRWPSIVAVCKLFVGWLAWPRAGGLPGKPAADKRPPCLVKQVRSV